jgi:hypothetical protein
MAFVVATSCGQQENVSENVAAISAADFVVDPVARGFGAHRIFDCGYISSIQASSLSCSLGEEILMVVLVYGSDRSSQ